MQPYRIKKLSVVLYFLAVAVAVLFQYLESQIKFGRMDIYLQFAGIMLLVASLVYGIVESRSGESELSEFKGSTQIFTADMMAGFGAVIAADTIVWKVIGVAGAFVVLQLIRRLGYEIRRKKYTHYIGKKGAVLQELVWEPGKYKGQAVIDNHKVKVIVAKESKRVPEGAKVEVIGMDGTKLIVTRCKQ